MVLKFVMLPFLGATSRRPMTDCHPRKISTYKILIMSFDLGEFRATYVSSNQRVMLF